jgi:hypothetical protein
MVQLGSYLSKNPIPSTAPVDNPQISPETLKQQEIEKMLAKLEGISGQATKGNVDNFLALFEKIKSALIEMGMEEGDFKALYLYINFIHEDMDEVQLASLSINAFEMLRNRFIRHLQRLKLGLTGKSAPEKEKQSVESVSQTESTPEKEKPSPESVPQTNSVPTLSNTGPVTTIKDTPKPQKAFAEIAPIAAAHIKELYQARTLAILNNAHRVAAEIMEMVNEIRSLVRQNGQDISQSVATNNMKHVETVLSHRIQTEDIVRQHSEQQKAEKEQAALEKPLNDLIKTLKTLKEDAAPVELMLEIQRLLQQSSHSNKSLSSIEAQKIAALQSYIHTLSMTYTHACFQAQLSHDEKLRSQYLAVIEQIKQKMMQIAQQIKNDVQSGKLSTKTVEGVGEILMQLAPLLEVLGIEPDTIVGEVEMVSNSRPDVDDSKGKVRK